MEQVEPVLVVERGGAGCVDMLAGGAVGRDWVGAGTVGPIEVEVEIEVMDVLEWIGGRCMDETVCDVGWIGGIGAIGPLVGPAKLDPDPVGPTTGMILTEPIPLGPVMFKDPVEFWNGYGAADGGME